MAPRKPKCRKTDGNATSGEPGQKPGVFQVTIDGKVKAHLARLAKQFTLAAKDDAAVFYDLCFVLCAPQTRFARNMLAQQTLQSVGFYRTSLTLEEVEGVLKGRVRFWRACARRLLEAKAAWPDILQLLRSDKPWAAKRTWLVENVNGLGMKTASHLLRNLGATDLAIIDTHVLKYLGIRGSWKYEAVEEVFRHRAKGKGLTVAELDMVVWQAYSGTPWDKYVA